MERKVPESIGDVLRSFLEETSLQTRLDELKGVELWAKVAGAEIAAECGKPIVKKGVMSIGVSNASLRNELHMSRSQFRNHINKLIGKEIIKEIRFIS